MREARLTVPTFAATREEAAKPLLGSRGMVSHRSLGSRETPGYSGDGGTWQSHACNDRHKHGVKHAGRYDRENVSSLGRELKMAGYVGRRCDALPENLPR